MTVRYLRFLGTSTLRLSPRKMRVRRWWRHARPRCHCGCRWIWRKVCPMYYLQDVEQRSRGRSAPPVGSSAGNFWRVMIAPVVHERNCRQLVNLNSDWRYRLALIIFMIGARRTRAGYCLLWQTRYRAGWSLEETKPSFSRWKLEILFLMVEGIYAILMVPEVGWFPIIATSTFSTVKWISKAPTTFPWKRVL